MAGPRPISPSFVVQEEGHRKVLVYLDIPELKVKRSFPNITKHTPTNVDRQEIDFQHQSLTLTLVVHLRNNETKAYIFRVRRLPGAIEPHRCSVKFQRAGCWITIIKADQTPWMNTICNDLNPGFDALETESSTAPEPSAPSQVSGKSLKDSEMPEPYKRVPIAPPPPYSATSTSGSGSTSKKAPAPPPPPLR